MVELGSRYDRTEQTLRELILLLLVSYGVPEKDIERICEAGKIILQGGNPPYIGEELSKRTKEVARKFFLAQGFKI